MKIYVSLLGTPRVKIDDKEVIFPYRKAEGLFYYLCVKGTVSRDETISVFWADCAENAARKNLRDAIYHLKRIFGENVVASEGNNKIVLCRDMFDDIDYLKITDLSLLEDYTEEFLGYFYIKNCLEFENWVSEIRDDLMRRYQKTIEKSVTEGVKNHDVKCLSKCGMSLLRRHNYDEDLFRIIMDGMHQSGGSESAVSLYHKLKESLRNELETDPEKETDQLFLRIKNSLIVKRESNKQDEKGEKFFCREAQMLAITDELYFFRTKDVSHSILITGEAGVGKTAILRNLLGILAEDEQYVTVFYQCVQNEENLYLKPWQDILVTIEDLCRKKGMGSHIDRHFLCQNEDGAVLISQYEMYIEGLMYMLSRGDDRRNLVIVIDDIQWLDKASRKLVSSVIRWSKNKQVMFILSCRSDSVHNLYEIDEVLNNGDLLKEIYVNRFSLGETGRIIRAQQPKLLEDKNALSEIYRNTGGNALFLFEMLRELQHGGTLVSLSKRTSSMIQSRLEGLTGEEHTILECISIFPRFATIEELELMTGRTSAEITKALRRLLTRQLVRVNQMFNKTGYCFQHQLIREYVYNRIPLEKRKAVHRISAERYEKIYLTAKDISLCPMLIYHFEKCDDVYKYYTYQLEYLKAFYAVEHEIYPTVLTAENSSPIVPQLGGEDELVTLAEKIRKLHQKSPDAAPLRMKVEFLIGRYDLFSGALKNGLENIHASIALAKDLGDNKCLFDNYLQIAFYTIQVHNLDLFNDYLSSCENLIQKYNFSDADQYTVTRLRGVYYMKKGNYGNAEQIFKDIIRKTEEKHKDDPAYQVGLAACYNYIGEGYQAENDPEHALTYYLHAINCCKDSKSVNSKGIFYANAGYLLYQMGEPKQAQVYIDKAIHCFEESNVLWGRSKAHSYAALLAIDRNDWKEAKEHYDEAKKYAIKGKNPVSLSLISELEKRMKSHRTNE